MRSPKLLDVNLESYNNQYLLEGFGDIHLGHKNCNVQMVKDEIKYLLDNQVNVILMGDLLESAQKNSPGTSVYEQIMDPQDQLDMMIDLLRPLAENGQILSAHLGNHEERISKNSGIDVMKILCDILHIKYAGYGVLYILRAGNMLYDVYAAHGTGNALTKASKRNKIGKMSDIYLVDLYMMGHVHMADFTQDKYKQINRRNKTAEDRTRTYCLTGHSLKYEDSYAEAALMVPSAPGFITMKLDSEEFNIEQIKRKF